MALDSIVQIRTTGAWSVRASTTSPLSQMRAEVVADSCAPATFFSTSCRPLHLHTAESAGQTETDRRVIFRVEPFSPSQFLEAAPAIQKGGPASARRWSGKTSLVARLCPQSILRDLPDHDRRRAVDKKSYGRWLSVWTFCCGIGTGKMSCRRSGWSTCAAHRVSAGRGRTATLRSQRAQQQITATLGPLPVANKADRADDWGDQQVGPAAQGLALKTSARTGAGVEEAFLLLARLMLKEPWLGRSGTGQGLPGADQHRDPRAGVPALARRRHGAGGGRRAVPLRACRLVRQPLPETWRFLTNFLPLEEESLDLPRLKFDSRDSVDLHLCAQRGGVFVVPRRPRAQEASQRSCSRRPTS